MQEIVRALEAKRDAARQGAGPHASPRSTRRGA